MKKASLLVLVSIFSHVFSGCSSGAMNYKNATITNDGKGFVITLRGKRVLHPASPVDIFLNNTYEDSMQYIVTKNNGIIKEKKFQLKVDIINIQVQLQLQMIC